jgi:hypothetical protein
MASTASHISTLADEASRGRGERCQGEESNLQGGREEREGKGGMSGPLLLKSHLNTPLVYKLQFQRELNV